MARNKNCAYEDKNTIPTVKHGGRSLIFGGVGTGALQKAKLTKMWFKKKNVKVVPWPSQ